MVRGWPSLESNRISRDSRRIWSPEGHLRTSRFALLHLSMVSVSLHLIQSDLISSWTHFPTLLPRPQPVAPDPGSNTFGWGTSDGCRVPLWRCTDPSACVLQTRRGARTAGFRHSQGATL